MLPALAHAFRDNRTQIYSCISVIAFLRKYPLPVVSRSSFGTLTALAHAFRDNRTQIYSCIEAYSRPSVTLLLGPVQFCCQAQSWPRFFPTHHRSLGLLRPAQLGTLPDWILQKRIAAQHEPRSVSNGWICATRPSPVSNGRICSTRS
ncbi:hypothetical protein VNO78_17085 [Psophocarpus tetragonolobus]|uniref:Uncharacterized protein n=1 Tax=Psophocarpus tetragonolobus TaxID=3891 RepID=A0AAN9SGG0_PSOTE